MQVSVDIEFPFAAADVWAVLRDFGNMGWLSSLYWKVETEGSGIGMIRRLYRPGDETPVIHRLDRLDDKAMRLECTVMQPRFFPVADLSMSIGLQPRQQGGCVATLDWHFSPPDDTSGAELCAVMESWSRAAAGQLLLYLEKPRAER